MLCIQVTAESNEYRLIAMSMIKLGIVHDRAAVAGKQQQFVLVSGPSSVARIQDLVVCTTRVA